MKIFVFLLLCFLNAITVFGFPAKSRAVLLLGFKEERQNLTLSLGSHDWTVWQHQEFLHQELARRFVEFFADESIETRVYLAATQSDLYQELQDPRNKILVWLSHSAEHAGGSETSKILDFQGRDVLPLFQTLDFNLKHIVVLGCEISFLKKNWSLRHPHTHLWQSGRGLLIRPVHQMLKKLREIQMTEMVLNLKDSVFEKAQSFNEPNSEPGLTLEFVRARSTSDEQLILPAVRIDNFNNQVLTVFPPMLPSESRQTKRITLPRPSENLDPETLHRELSFMVIDPVLKPDYLQASSLGHFSIKPNEDQGNPYRWKPLTDKKGKLVGKTKNIYQFIPAGE